jgi:hypothetical protein
MQRSRDANIAVQRAGGERSAREGGCVSRKNNSRIHLTAPRSARFSPAPDVLPFSRLSTSPDQVRFSNVQKITVAAFGLHRE